MVGDPIDESAAPGGEADRCLSPISGDAWTAADQFLALEPIAEASCRGAMQVEGLSEVSDRDRDPVESAPREPGTAAT